MIYVGFDIGKEKHCMAAISESADVLIKPVFVEQNHESFEKVAARLHQLGDPSQVRIGMEASGYYWTHLFHFLNQEGWTVDLFNPVLSQARARCHLRGRKTDKDDAVTIAKTLRDGAYTPWAIPSDEHSKLKLLCRQRTFIVHELANAKRRLTSLLSLAFPELSNLFSDPHGKAPMAVLSEAATAQEVAALSVRKLTSILSKNSRARHGLEMARKITAAAKTSIAYDQHNPELAWMIRGMLNQLEFFQKQIDEVDQRIEMIFQSIETPIKEIPGIGDKTAPMIVAELGDLSRFKGGYKTLLAFAGLDPRIRQSGQWKGTVKMSKRGSPSLRTALFQAASMGRIHNPALQEIYQHHRYTKGKNHRVAISHVARKIVQIIWATCRNSSRFDPDKILPKIA
jgi:transposase